LLSIDTSILLHALVAAAAAAAAWGGRVVVSAMSTLAGVDLPLGLGGWGGRWWIGGGDLHVEGVGGGGMGAGLGGLNSFVYFPAPSLYTTYPPLFQPTLLRCLVCQKLCQSRFTFETC
jgi:hypothetical protein